MDGNASENEKVKWGLTMNLRDWISDSCSKSGFADIHIDHLDPRWKKHARWIEGGMSILQEAMAALALTNCNYKLAMVYTLRATTDTLNIDFATAEEFSRRFDHSPPSLFIAEPGSEPWITSWAYEGVQIGSIPESVVERVFPIQFECRGLLMRYFSDGEQEPSLTAWFLPSCC